MIRDNAIHMGRLHQISVRVDRLHSIGMCSELEFTFTTLLIAFATGNRVVVEDQAHALLQTTHANSYYFQNAIIPLISMGSVKLAVQATAQMVQAYPGSKQVLDHAITHATICLQFSKALELIETYNALAVNEFSPYEPELISTLLRSHEMAQALEITEESMLARLQTAVDAVRAYGVEVLHQSRLVLHDGTFISQFFVNAPATECANLNFVIADALVENYEDVGAELFSVICRPLTDFYGATKGATIV